jgi:tRNA threonylcarbamoyladenosine biosynthesis protein TsaB
MVRILHIETATQQCGVALSEGTDVICHKQTLDKGFKHATQLHPFIDQVLQEAGVKPHELDAIAVSTGPGSYTGLRIGSVAAKGLCFALDIPLIALPTLTVLAAP